jgi:hypothetical protein
MSPVPQSKPAKRTTARSARVAERLEDDAEQALKEILAAQAKCAGRQRDGARQLRKKRTNGDR